MTTKKLLTAKKLLPCLRVNDIYVILRSDGKFIFHYTTNTVDPLGNEELMKMASFDEAPFIAAYDNYMAEKRRKIDEEKKAAEEREAARIAVISERIKNCEDIEELINEFDLKDVETASHWSDLYEGRSGRAIIIGDRQDKEVLDMAIDMLGISGEWGECKHRDGEHHNTFGAIYEADTIDGYREVVERHFSSDHYFWKSKETEAGFLLTEKIKEITEEYADTPEIGLGKVADILNEFDDLESGYYDCNGNLIMPDIELNSDDFTGYSEDVYTYSYAFNLTRKN